MHYIRLFLVIVISLISGVWGFSQGETNISGDLIVTSGVMSGDVTSSSAVVWSRASAPATMQVIYSVNAELENSSTIEGKAIAEKNFTAKVLLENLEDDTTYYYQATFTNDANTSEFDRSVLAFVMSIPTAGGRPS